MKMICPTCHTKGFDSKVVDFNETETRLKCYNCGEWNPVKSWGLDKLQTFWVAPKNAFYRPIHVGALVAAREALGLFLKTYAGQINNEGNYDDALFDNGRDILLRLNE